MYHVIVYYLLCLCIILIQLKGEFECRRARAMGSGVSFGNTAPSKLDSYLYRKLLNIDKQAKHGKMGI